MDDNPLQNAHDLAVTFGSERIMAWLLDPEHVARPSREDLIDEIEDALILVGYLDA